MTQVTEC